MRRSRVALQQHDGIKQILIVLSAVWAYEIARMFVEPLLLARAGVGA